MSEIADLVIQVGFDGAELLEDVHTFLGRFVSYPSEEAHTAHTLWVAHTWLMDAWDSTPRLAFLSPEPGSGKTRALEASEPLTRNALHMSNVSPAYLFRRISAQAGVPTLLYDEVDTVFGVKQRESAEEIRSLLNAGHRRSGVVGRAVTTKDGAVGTEELPAYAAVALAGLGDLPDTIMSRAVVIRMRRRAPGEYVEAWRERDCKPQAEPIALRLADWA